MPVAVTPIKAKGTLYLLIPKNIASILEINEDTTFNLKIKKDSKKGHTLQYEVSELVDNSKRKKRYKPVKNEQKPFWDSVKNTVDDLSDKQEKVSVDYPSWYEKR